MEHIHCFPPVCWHRVAVMLFHSFRLLYLYIINTPQASSGSRCVGRNIDLADGKDGTPTKEW
jgi:hypothetical protein